MVPCHSVKAKKPPPQTSRPVTFNLMVQGHCNSIALLTSRGNESLLWRGKYGAAYSSQRAQLMSRQQLGTVATSLPALCLHAHRKICPQQIWVSTSCTSLTLAKF